MSVIISVFSGAALRSSAITRRGSIGVSSEAFSGSMKFDHSSFHASTWSCHGERSRFGSRPASSSSCFSTSRASPTIPSSVG